MDKKAVLTISLMFALIIGGCAEQAEGNASDTATPEPLVVTVSGYSLEELGFAASLPALDWLSDPNDKEGSTPPILAVYHFDKSPMYLNHEYVNGSYTSIDLEVTDSDKQYSNISLRFLQGYKTSELTGEKKVARIGENYLPLDEVEKYVIKRSGDIIICDFTELCGGATFGSFDGYLDYLQAENLGYDYSWIGDLYDFFSENVRELISEI